MWLKTIFSFIVAHLFLFGTTSPKVSTIPVSTSSTPIVSAIATTSTKIATSTPLKTKIVAKIAVKPVSKTIETNQSTSTPNTYVEPTYDFELINTFARKAIVNILCTAKGGELSPISGTGIIINPNGLILTNAHIAEYFLLRDFRQKDFLECVIRTGSPAYPKYNAEIVYISPTWVEDNKSLLKEAVQKGTGENDFAFLRIVSAINGSDLPQTFSYIPMNVSEIINKNEPVLLASYAAGFLGGLSILQNLSIATAVTNVQDYFTFKQSTIDLLSVGGTIVSQKGSSGGAVVDSGATVIGMISTSSDGNTTSNRELNAITSAYINRSLQNELGMTLLEFENQDIAKFAKKFQEINVPNLTKLITDELSK